MNENIQVTDTERKEWIIHQLFLSMVFLIQIRENHLEC